MCTVQLRIHSEGASMEKMFWAIGGKRRQFQLSKTR
jgi:hypothetical protein